MSGRPEGVIAPLVTPRARDGGVSADGVRELVESVRARVSGLMPCISSGEGWRLTADQWRSAVAGTVEASRGLPVYAGCQALDWDLMEQRARWAEELGVDAVVLSIPALHGAATDDALLAGFARIKRRLRTPVVYYWESFVSGRRLGLEPGLRICAELDAVAVKDSMRDAALTASLLERFAGSVSVLQGWEDVLSPDLPVDGYVGPLALLSDSVASLFSDSPRWAEISREAARYGVLDSDYIARAKAELHRRGVIPLPHEFPGVPGVRWDG